MSTHENMPKGWLYKWSRFTIRNTWQKRYFVLCGKELRYYKSPNDARPAGVIELRHYECVKPYSTKQSSHAFQIVSQCKHHRTHIMYADNDYDHRLWMTLVEANIPNMADRHQCEFVDDASHATYHSVLDKWLERLDLHDSKEPSAYAETLVGYSSTPLTSPTLRTCQSSESLESGCSSEQATLSSSAGSALAADLGKTRLLKSNNLSNNGNMMPPQSLRRAINTATDKKTLSRSLPLSITTSLSSHRLDSDRDRTSHPSILNRSSIISDHDMDHFAYEVFAFEDETTPASPLQLTEQLPPCMPPPTSPLPPLPGLLQRIGQNGSISSNRRQ